MDSKLSARTVLIISSATALSGAAFYFSAGMFPPWWLTWLAALPVLWAAPRVRWWEAALLAFIARGLGGLNGWFYRADGIKFPLWSNLEWVLLPALELTVAVVLFRIFLKRRQPWLAVLAFPSLMVASEYLASLVNGTFGNPAYTQMDQVLVLQIGALAGIWGISFVVQLLAPMIATIAAPAIPTRRRQHLAIALVLVFPAVFAYGAWRTWTTPPAQTSVRVGLLASIISQNILPSTDQDALRLMHDYARQVPILAAQGAQIIVLPEMTALVRDSISSQVDTLFEQTARSAHTQILLGILHVVGVPDAAQSVTYNEARLYSGSATAPVIYRKHHPVPVLEHATPASGIAIVHEPLGKIGLEICRDMDYSDPARRYGQEGVGLLLVPAWDQYVDRWWHGHMALMRGVENGYSIVRTAKSGFLTVSDDRGRILAEATNTPTQTFTTLMATVPVRHDPTLYQSWGDWFAWLALASSAGLLLLALRTGRSTSTIATLTTHSATL
jgi:apolipoprotein N-acyltransferase